MFDGENAPAYHDGQMSAPPAYSSLTEAVAAEMISLSVGDLHETISVPMILSHEQKRKRDAFLLVGRKTPVIRRTVVVRKMKREHYLKHYAKDAQGNYIGTEKAAVDAGLVFVPGKSSDEDILEQVRKVAFGKEHGTDDFGCVVGGGMAAGGGF